MGGRLQLFFFTAGQKRLHHLPLSMRIAGSVGVVLYHGKKESVDSLLQQADSAMYLAKNSGRNKVCFFGA